MKAYLLFYDTDFGSREEWNTFYTPCEMFATAAARQARIDHIQKECPGRFEFHELDVEEMTPDQVRITEIVNDDREDDDEDES